MQTLNAMQDDMRLAFWDGAPGMLVSALVWLIAGVVALQLGVAQAIWALLIGGALIHPVATVVLKLLGRSAKPQAGNALNSLAFASTIWLIACCVLAYGLSRAQPGWFFPAMMLAIGSRYLTFHALYGLRLYWFCGGALIAAGYFCFAFGMAPAYAAFVGGGVEVVFALALLFARKAVPAAA
ncbi:MAG: DUF7010 family protein [Pseudomonadota bacterium]